MSHPCFEKLRIFAPGPTPVPEEVLAAMSLPPLHHRTLGFEEILVRTWENLKFLFQTKEPVYVLASSGTGAMEATVTNLCSPGDEVLVVNGGKFGERWTKIAEKHALKVHELKVAWGESASPDDITALLKKNPRTRLVLLQASETSTGTYHPVKEIAAAVKSSSEALVCVDAITALGVCDLPMDSWGLDAVVSGSQKALMLPPGLAFLALSARARKARDEARGIANFYFDLKAEDQMMAKKQTAWTPAVNLIVGLDLVLQRMREAGLPAIFRHHARLAEGTRRGVQAMGLELLAKTRPADSVTAVMVPKAIKDGTAIINTLRDRFGMTIAEGQDAFKGRMFRLAHLGYFDELDMLTVLSATETALYRHGYQLELGKGVGAAAKFFLENEK